MVCSPGSWLDAAEARALGLHRGGVVRSIVLGMESFFEWVGSLREVVDICALLQPNQTNGLNHDPAAWDEYLSGFIALAIGRVRYVEIANEQDLWGVPPEALAPIISLAAPKLAAAGMQPILPSVAGPTWQAWAERLAALVPRKTLDLCYGNGHPYGRNPDGQLALPFGQIEEMLSILVDVYGVPCVATESGAKYGDVGGDADDALDWEDIAAHEQYTIDWVQMVQRFDPHRYPFLCFFAWSDWVGSPGERGEQAFGLRDLDGEPRPSWLAFARLNGGEIMADDGGFVLGFAEMYRADPQLVGRRTGPNPQFPPVPGLHVAVATSEKGTLLWTLAENAESGGSPGHVMLFVKRDGTTFVYDPATAIFKGV